MSRGSIRRGEALLAGLLRCGHCGRKLHVAYSGKNRPWLGYLMMLEHHPNALRAAKPKKLSHYPMRPEFQGISYAQRYEIFCERLVRERLYDATCFLMSNQHGGLQGEYSEPNDELSFRNFAVSLTARAAAFTKLQERS